MSTPAPLEAHDLDHRVPAPFDPDDHVIAVAVLPDGWEAMSWDQLDAALGATLRFSRTGTDDMIDEWMDAAQADPVDQRPRGWRAWQMRRAYRDLTITAELDRGEA